MRLFTTGIFILALGISIQAQELTTESPAANEASEPTPVPYVVKGASYDPQRNLIPYFSEVYSTSAAGIEQLTLSNVVTKPVSPSAGNIKGFQKYINNDFTITIHYGTSRGERRAFASINALRYDPNSGQLEELVSYTPEWSHAGSGPVFKTSAASSFANNSVLASGTWYKVAVAKNGVYKIDKTLLSKMGSVCPTYTSKHSHLWQRW